MNLYVETLKSFLGLSEFSSAGLLFMVLKNVNLFIPKSKYEHYYNINEDLKLKFKVSNNLTKIVIFNFS